MARPHIESISAYGVAPVALDAGPFAGAACRTLSADPDDGSATTLMSFPAGWSGELAGERPTELLVLRGAGVLGDHTLRAGAWAWIPAGAQPRMLRFDEDTEALVMIEPPRPAGGEIEIVDVVDARFEEIHVVEGVPYGLALKTLRVDPQLGERSWIAGATPGWLGFRGEIHPTVEEGFLLQGDCLLANSGPMVAGDYFWRPGAVHHGPFATRAGMLYYFRTKGGDLEVTWDDPPDWGERARRYYDAEPWFTPAR